MFIHTKWEPSLVSNEYFGVQTDQNQTQIHNQPNPINLNIWISFIIHNDINYEICLRPSRSLN